MDTFWPWWFLWCIFWAVFGITMSRIRWGHRRHWDKPVDKSAIDILKERYAKGEISKQEFEEKRQDLTA